jgi:hypothetical protein
MDGCDYAPALLLLQLMHAFMTEKHAQRAQSLAAPDSSSCSSPGVVPEGYSFLFSANEPKFRNAQDALDAAVAYLARPSLPRILQPTPDSIVSSASNDASISPALLIIMGADSLPLVHEAAAAFINTWHAAGCRRIVITGGIGRATPDLIRSFKKRSAEAIANQQEWTHVSLPQAHALGGPPSLPFLHDYSAFSVAWPPALVAQLAAPTPPLLSLLHSDIVQICHRS